MGEKEENHYMCLFTHTRQETPDLSIKIQHNARGEALEPGRSRADSQEEQAIWETPPREV